MKAALRATAGAAVIALAAGCGTAAAHARPSRSPAPLTTLQACRALRADILANGTQPDAVTLRRLLARLPTGTPSGPGKLAGDIGLASKDIGTSLWPLDAAQLSRDCRSTGVQIPGG